MKLLLKRTTKKDTYTIGKLYIDGEYFCDTLEDKSRGLTSSMSASEISKIKVKGETAIPTGTYDVTLNVVSPKYSSSSFMQQYANGARVPRLLDVPGYEGVLIHTGNTAADTDGCILVGKNSIVGQLTSSRATFQELYPILQKANEIKITIEE